MYRMCVYFSNIIKIIQITRTVIIKQFYLLLGINTARLHLLKKIQFPVILTRGTAALKCNNTFQCTTDLTSENS